MDKTVANLNETVWKDNSFTAKCQIPIDVFPVQIQNIITDYNKYLNYPIEFTSASILGATSVTMGNCIRLEVIKRWIEKPILFIIMIQDRGYKKSHPMDEIFNPIFLKEELFAEQFDESVIEFKNQLKEDKDFDGDEPVKKRITISRFSPEVLYKIHKNNPKGIIIHCDEAKAWFGTFNQQSNNADEQMWCNMYNGKHLQRDTITHGHQYIANAFVSILGGTQPDEIMEFIKKNTNNGLVDRILFIYPDYLKKQKWSKTDIPSTTVEQWENIYSNLSSLFKYDPENIKTVKYTDEAFEKLCDWQSKINDEDNEKEDKIFTGIVAKAETNVHRIAMILEALSLATNGENSMNNVGLTAVNGAIKLIEYFIDEALKVRNYSNKSKTDFKSIWFDLLPKEFTTEEAITIAKKHKLAQRKTVFNWLDSDNIMKVEHGKYKKKLK